MPNNNFPDSAAKRELRRQDARRLAAFQSEKGFPSGLNYCGMPSVEFLDVQAWQSVLRSVCALEYDQDMLQDMRIEWDRLCLDLPIHFVKNDILDFLKTSNDVYDLYNLDFYGGFLHANNRGASRCADAIRNLISRQASRANSFVLIATFNVRDKGAVEYLQFIDRVPKALRGWENVDACCNAHKKNNITRLKLCFPYFCWQVGMSNNFEVKFEDPVVYHSSATMLHFYGEFIYRPHALPELTSTEVLAELASRPLMRLEGMIQRIDMQPPEITRS
jgi:hypothetical protein